MTRIIRGEGPRPPRRRAAPGTTRVLRAPQLQALHEADQTLERARVEAARLLDYARREAEAVRARAAEEGAARAVGLLAAAEQRAARLLEASGGELTELAVRVAEKILGEALRLQPERVTTIVAQCLRSARGARLRLRVCPADLALVEEALPALRGAAPDAAVLALEPDPQLTPGDCVIESELGQVDGRLAVQLAALREALRS